MSSYVTKYEFVGQDSAGLRGGEVQFQVSKTVPRLATSRRGFPWGLPQVPVAIPVEKLLNRPFPGRAVSHCSIQRCLRRSRSVALGILRGPAADSGDSAWESVNSHDSVMIPVMEPG